MKRSQTMQIRAGASNYQNPVLLQYTGGTRTHTWWGAVTRFQYKFGGNITVAEVDSRDVDWFLKHRVRGEQVFFLYTPDEQPSGESSGKGEQTAVGNQSSGDQTEPNGGDQKSEDKSGDEEEKEGQGGEAPQVEVADGQAAASEGDAATSEPPKQDSPKPSSSKAKSKKNN